MNWYIGTEVCWNNWIALINPLYLVTVWLLLRDVYLSINGMCWDFWFGRDHLRWIDSPQWEWTTANPFIIISFILVFWFPPDLNSHCHWAFIKAAAALRHSNHLGTERGEKKRRLRSPEIGHRYSKRPLWIVDSVGKHAIPQLVTSPGIITFLKSQNQSANEWQRRHWRYITYDVS